MASQGKHDGTLMARFFRFSKILAEGRPAVAVRPAGEADLEVPG